ncbi:hypothetical protein GCM10027275_22180 [Rhabdobacter roseus]|uniref:Putative transposase/invertase (TIGR01784 family) n=1 Tax=Rhabdobacter roseus TaxID=1655419 RepID=A0A840TSB0_9BACT|nr:hypothetical protein [Rhabdobacter roseus]MBB5284153.1 putative transposase/invertase (TIGR01784 family) [Rhabdobacter roseus]
MAEFVERYINGTGLLLTTDGLLQRFKELFGEEFTPDQIRSYEDSLKYYRDLKNSLDTAREEGVLEGIEKGRLEAIEKVAKNLIKMGIDADIIAETTGLTIQQIEKLKNTAP